MSTFDRIKKIPQWGLWSKERGCYSCTGLTLSENESELEQYQMAEYNRRAGKGEVGFYLTDVDTFILIKTPEHRLIDNLGGWLLYNEKEDYYQVLLRSNGFKGRIEKGVEVTIASSKEMICLSEEWKQIKDEDTNFKALTDLIDVYRDYIAEEKAKVNEESLIAEQFDYKLPHGAIRDLAGYIYKQSIRPLQDPCIAGAIATFASIVGRAYNINESGLNLYVVFIAETGTGKGSVKKGINKLFSAVANRMGNDDCYNFLGTSDIASPQGMLQALNKQPCLMIKYEDFGHTMKNWTDTSNRTNQVTRGVRKMMLEMFDNSDASAFIPPTTHSDKTKDTNKIISPAVTILADATPENFYANITPEAISDGLIPRFMIVDCGRRIKRRQVKKDLSAAKIAPSSELVAKFTDYIQLALEDIKSTQVENDENGGAGVGHSVTNVRLTREAEKIISEFDDFCDDKMDECKDETFRQIWNRTGLKAFRVAGLFAVSQNMYDPVVTEEIADFAVKWCKNESERLHSLLMKNDAPVQHVYDNRIQRKAFCERIRDLIYNNKAKGVAGEQGWVKYGDITRTIVNKACFQRDPRGSNNALKLVLKSLIEEGVISRVHHTKVKSAGVGKDTVVIEIKDTDLFKEILEFNNEQAN